MIKKIFYTIILLLTGLSVPSYGFANSNNNNNYTNIAKRCYIQYNNIYNGLSNNSTLQTKSDSNKGNFDNSTNNPNDIKINLWIWKYRNEIEKKNEEIQKHINKALWKYLLWTLKIQTDVDENLLKSVKKLKANDSIFVFLQFKTKDYFVFNQIGKTLLLLPYNIKVNWQNKISISFFQEKINNVFKSNKKQKEQLKQLKQLFNKYKIKYQVIDNISFNSTGKNSINLFLGEKYSFFNNTNIPLFASSYYKIENTDFIKNKNIKNVIKKLNNDGYFYLWGTFSEKDISNFFKNIWKSNYNRNNLLAYFQLPNNIEYVADWIIVHKTKNNISLKKNNFYTLQYSDKIWGNNVKAQYNYSFKKNYNYILYSFLVLLFWIWTAYLLFRTNYKKRTKILLEKISDNI